MSGCVWYISKYFAPPDDPAGEGAGGRSYELMRELAANDVGCVVITSDANHVNAVPDFEGPQLVERRHGMVLCWLRTMKSEHAKSLRRIGGWLHFEWQLFRFPTDRLPRPDVVVVSCPSPLTIVNGLRLKRRLGVRLVYEVRDIWPLTLVDEGGYSPRNPLILALAMLERLGYRHADAVVGTMPNLREHVTNVLGTQRPVHCIPMGYSPRALDHVVELPDEFLETYLPKDRFTIAYAGTIGISNALETLFAAVEAMQAREDVHFLILGDGSLLPEYRQEFDRLPNLTFVPRVVKDAVPSLLARCDLLYLSTRSARLWTYGQSLNKLIDYMLSARPVVASYSGSQSMINEADSGSFVPAGDVGALLAEIERYIEMGAEERDRMGRRGREWILRHRGYPGLAEEYARLLFESPEDCPGVSPLPH